MGLPPASLVASRVSSPTSAGVSRLCWSDKAIVHRRINKLAQGFHLQPATTGLESHWTRLRQLRLAKAVRMGTGGSYEQALGDVPGSGTGAGGGAPLEPG